MSLPVVYTEGTLLTLLETEVGPIGVALGLLTSEALAEAVNDTVGILGHALADETTVAGVMKVRAIGIWRAWLAVEAAAISSPSKLKSDGDEIDYSQRLEAIRFRLARAEAAASVYPEVQAASGAGGVAVVSSLSSSDPYSPYGYTLNDWWS